MTLYFDPFPQCASATVLFEDHRLFADGLIESTPRSFRSLLPFAVRFTVLYTSVLPLLPHRTGCFDLTRSSLTEHQ